MISGANSARDEILDAVRGALGRRPGQPAPPVPPTARVPARVPGSADDEITMLLAEISKLGGRTRRLDADGLKDALAELIQIETIRKATLWQTTELQALGVSEILAGLGVEIVSSQAGKDALACCDLGVTGVDMALPETGTLVLRASPQQPRAVSLLPRVHLALVRPANLRAGFGGGPARDARGSVRCLRYRSQSHGGYRADRDNWRPWSSGVVCVGGGAVRVVMDSRYGRASDSIFAFSFQSPTSAKRMPA